MVTEPLLSTRKSLFEEVYPCTYFMDKETKTQERFNNLPKITQLVSGRAGI